MHHRHLTTWFLGLLVLLQRVQADHVAEDCREYCLKCGNSSNYKTPNVPMRSALEVSLQTATDGKLPVAHIILHGSKPYTDMIVNQENVTLRIREVRKRLTLESPQPALSWITLVLAPAGQDTLLVYTPTDRHNVISANINHGSFVSVSSNVETHVAFNCLSGCLIRNSSSALVGGEIELQPPFTMYLNPRPHPRPRTSKHSETPVFTLTSVQGVNKTVNASKWTPGMWYKMKILLTEDEQEQKNVMPQKGKDGVNEAQISVTNDTYKLTQLKGFSWTLHCAPKGLIDASASSASPDPEASSSTPSPEKGEVTGGEGEGKKSKQKTGAGGAGAGQVAAWVMAGLALFLVMVLALALCTKTAQHGYPHHVHDSQPSVGIVYCKGATREPDEDSEPESPNELKVPPFRNSPKYPMAVEG